MCSATNTAGSTPTPWICTHDPQALHPDSARTDADYRAALAQAARYTETNPDPDSAEGAHFDALVTLIEAWEARHRPVLPPDPVEAIKFRMEQAG